MRRRFRAGETVRMRKRKVRVFCGERSRIRSGRKKKEREVI